MTVAVIDENSSQFVLNDSDLIFRNYKASGAGGQHKNKTESAVQITHKPTGISAQCESERCQHKNRKRALLGIKAKLEAHHSNKTKNKRDGTRRAQIGTGLRGDKVQTVQEQNGMVINHINKKKVPIKNYLKGRIDLLHKK